MVACSANAQIRISISGGSVDDRPIPQLEIDSALYKISYRMSFIPDTTNRENRRDGVVMLYVGKNNRCLFIDKSEVESDSLSAKARAAGENPFSSGTFVSVGRKVFKPVIAVNYPHEGDVLYQEFGGIETRYIDHDAVMDWTITDESRDILGYECRKATTDYRGRHYEAWYAEDLPLGFGPYMFRGLPGLIFEINDTAREYEFSLLGFERLAQPFVLTIDDYQVEKMTRDEFRKLERAKYNDPMMDMSGGVENLHVYDSDGKEIKHSAPRPYNPIERE